MSRWWVSLAALPLLAGCGPAARSTVAPAGPPAPADGPVVVVPSGGPTWTIKVATVDGRRVLVDQENHALYMFTRDAAVDSACLNQCALTWPPFVGRAHAGSGLRQGDFATISRSDGHSQVTFDGHPLYYFVGDARPGDTNGQGIAGAWYLIGADGQPAR